MGIDSKIEWTDHTWNPWYGCPDDGNRSPACDNCYASRWAKRSGLVRFDRELKFASVNTLTAPLSKKKFIPGDKVFVCSLSDVCHEMATDNMIRQMWATVSSRPDLTWIFLTKRPEGFGRLLHEAQRIRPPRCGANYPKPNWWLGVTVENQEQADKRIPELLKVPAALHFVSCEPMLGPVNLSPWLPPYGRPDEPAEATAGTPYPQPHLNWVICGGESGPNARPMHPDWPLQLRAQCSIASVRFFFKQWGEWAPESFEFAHKPNAMACGVNPTMVRVGKKEAGRELDGHEHLEFPEVVNA